MNEEQAFSALRQRMLAEIAAKTIFSTARLGKAALRSAGDGRHGQGAAPRVRAARAAALRLRQHALAHRLRQDDLAALHRRGDDRPARRAADVTRCWRSAPGWATRRRSWRSLPGSVYSVELIEELADAGPAPAGPAGHTNVEVQHRQRLPWLARARALRQDDRHGRARVDPSTADGPSAPRGKAGYGRPVDHLSVERVGHRLDGAAVGPVGDELGDQRVELDRDLASPRTTPHRSVRSCRRPAPPLAGDSG